MLSDVSTLTRPGRWQPGNRPGNLHSRINDGSPQAEKHPLGCCCASTRAARRKKKLNAYTGKAEAGVFEFFGLNTRRITTAFAAGLSKPDAGEATTDRLTTRCKTDPRRLKVPALLAGAKVLAIKDGAATGVPGEKK